jgi:hypothetical protein
MFMGLYSVPCGRKEALFDGNQNPAETLTRSPCYFTRHRRFDAPVDADSCPLALAGFVPEPGTPRRTCALRAGYRAAAPSTGSAMWDARAPDR